jgi:hypothetical protein
LHHVSFETEGEDEFGYPISKLNAQGEPIVKELIPYTLPYLKEEVIAIFNWLKNNRDVVKSKKK